MLRRWRNGEMAKLLWQKCPLCPDNIRGVGIARAGEDGLEWSPQVIGAFGPVITLSNGTVVHNSYVERPQVRETPSWPRSWPNFSLL
jgi:hypothetical protein